MLVKATDSSDPQLLKALVNMDSVASGMLILTMPLDWKAYAPMVVREESSAKVTFTRLLQPANAWSPINVTVLAIFTLFSAALREYVFGTIKVPSMISKWPFASILGSGAPGIPQSLESLVGTDDVNSTVEGKPMVYKRDDPVNAELAMFIELAQDTYTALSWLQYANALLPTVVTVSGMENPTSPLA